MASSTTSHEEDSQMNLSDDDEMMVGLDELVKLVTDGDNTHLVGKPLIDIPVIDITTRSSVSAMEWMPSESNLDPPLSDTTDSGQLMEIIQEEDAILFSARSPSPPLGDLIPEACSSSVDYSINPQCPLESTDGVGNSSAYPLADITVGAINSSDISLEREDKSVRNVIADKTKWAREETKMNRMKGLPYMGYSRKNKNDNRIMLRNSPKEARIMGPLCPISSYCSKWSNRKCHEIDGDVRQCLFNDFWSKMNWGEREMFIASLVDFSEPKRRVQKLQPKKKRALTYSYHLKVGEKRLPVCQTTFLNTFGLKNSMVRHWLTKYCAVGVVSPIDKDPDVEIDESLIETKENEPTAQEIASPKTVSPLSTGMLKMRNQHLGEYLLKMPLMPSHYCRQSTNRLYLQADIESMTQFYNLYVERCGKDFTAPLSKTTFNRQCKAKRISIFHPRKDLCDTCFKYRMQNLSKQVYDKHIEIKNQAQEEKRKDKILGEKGEYHVLCADVMAVKLLPSIQASLAYYKMKLATHNYTVYNLANHDAMCFWFTESGSSLVASTFATCLVEEIERLLDQDLREVIIYTDGCTNQNRNAVMSNALLSLSVQRNVTIHQKILEKGHTMMEGDSVHSAVENVLEKKEIFLPHELVQWTKEARKDPFPYRAILMNYDDFKDYSRPETMRYSSIRPGNKPNEPVVTDLRWLKYTSDGNIAYKLNFNDDNFSPLPRRPLNAVVSPNDFPGLNNNVLPIPKDKYDDLQSLREFMPKECQYFYESLIHYDQSVRKRKQLAKAEESKSKKKTKAEGSACKEQEKVEECVSKEEEKSGGSLRKKKEKAGKSVSLTKKKSSK